MTASPLVVPIRTVVIEDSLAGAEADLAEALDLGGRLAVVSDATTHNVMGRRIEQALGRIAEVQSVVLPEHPEPDAETVGSLRSAAADADALIAVGSGTSTTSANTPRPSMASPTPCSRPRPR